MRVVASIVVLAAASGIAAPAHQIRDASAPAPPRTGTAVLSGTVVSDDELKRPIRRATVSVTDEGGSHSGLMTVTNDAGEFVVTGLPAGRYLVSATKGAYLATAYGATRQQRPGTVRTGTAVAVSEGQQVAGLVLRMMRGGVITGVVHDQSGRPARGVGVVVAYYARSPQNGERVITRFSFEGTGSTDSRGVYRIYGLPPGEYVIAGSPSGFVTTDLLLTTDTERARASATSRAEAQATPVVTRPRVGFVPVYYPGTAIPANATPVRVMAGEERAGIDFALQLVPNSRVDGAVIGLDGQPVPQSPVLLHSDAKPAGLDTGRLAARTDAQGRFSVRGVPPGNYTLASSAGDAWGTTSISLQGDDVAANIQLRTATVVAGRVGVEEGLVTKLDLSRVRLRLAAESSALPLAGGGYPFQVGADGSFKVPVMPGRYRIQVTAPAVAGSTSNWILKSAILGKQDVVDQAFDVRDGDSLPEAVLTLTSAASELSGRMTGAEGLAAPDYFVIVFPADSALWGWQARRIQQTRPSHDGTFAFKSLPPGEYHIAAVADVEQNEWFDSEFLKSLSEASIRVSLAAGEKKTQLIQVK